MEYFKQEIRIALSFTLLSFTLYCFYIPCRSTGVKISSKMVCKSTYMYMYDRVNILRNILLIMDGQIKSKRLCRSTLTCLKGLSHGTLSYFKHRQNYR